MKVTKEFHAEVKSRDDANLIVEHFISTERRDRQGDIVRASGMRVNGKPVVLLGHGRGDMGSEPVAKPLSIKRGEYQGSRGVLAKTQFFPDDTGRRLYQKTVEGYMPNWSIGFMILDAKPLKGQREGDLDGRDIREWELLEYSLVGVPANPDAQTVKEFEQLKEAVRFKIETTVTGVPKCAACADTKVVYYEFDGEQHAYPCQKCGLDPDWTKEKWDDEWEGEEKPYPNEHACRVADPDQFPKKRRQNDKFGPGVHVIWGIKDGKTHLQAIRFSAAKFTASAAKAWLKAHDRTCIMFEAATGKEGDLDHTDPVFKILAGDPDPFSEIVKQLLEQGKQIAELSDKVAKLMEQRQEPAPPAEPAPEAKEGDPAPGDNAPEPKAIPRLVIDDSERERQEKAEDLKKLISRFISEAREEQRRENLDRIMGKVK
jgi:hypothetical protein